MRVGELAARTGVSVRALRYYEEQHLLTAERSASGQRHYPDGAVDRVRLIQELYAAGLSSRTIVELMPCVVEGRATPELLDRLAAERERVDRRVTDLLRTRDRLDAVIGGASGNLRTGVSCRARSAAGAPPAEASSAGTSPDRAV
ncbi:putative MerR family transcriptional regulator [Actinacidiphila reveromycinica]|uniref:Putative MerR family transcriptional regulator n=1 Tax=Actinacidiphila reveromycinica TaxID=659352 RepID=A0A7U3VL76_9ACTN|nr:MerR family transcriptional regulator [Streptomyces sp. SN-593]BBA95255.1 putative MerR family transcriptional regulator [Streptomyces sp. SN-593]